MEIHTLIRSSTFKLANATFWLVLFTYSCLKRGILFGERNWQDIVYWSGSYFFVLWILSPLVFYYFQNSRYSDYNTFIKYHVIRALLFGIAHFVLTGISTLLFERLFGFEEHYTFNSLLDHLKNNWIELFEGVGWYVIILVLLLALHYYTLYREEQKHHEVVKSDLVSSNLQILSTQLSPHFLFNAMNSIAMMTRRSENKRAVSMIAALSDMLRMSMSKHNDQLVALQSEIDLLNKYLLLEKERFKDRVEVNMSFPENTLNISVPRLVLQPLVENAFKHGVANNIEKSVIEVSSKKENNQLVLSVFNSGNMSSNWDLNSASSLGLPNTIHRLRQLYASNFSFKVIEQDKGVLFEISLPLVLPS